VDTPWIAEAQLRTALERNEAFWVGGLEEYPLLWVTAPGAVPGTPPAAPPTDREQWIDVDYQMAKAEDALSRTYFAADALPIYNPWLGPDQFAAWLGGPLSFSTKDNTSWTRPVIEEWPDPRSLRIDPQNSYWRTYLDILRASVDRGRGRWVTGYPDLHTGIDGLGALRGAERLMMDLLAIPETVQAAMRRMTELWKQIVDIVSGIVLPTGQGTTNWTYGWSKGRFVCVGQNDLSCLIGPDMFDEFVREDTEECARYVDRTIYHLDGPDAVKHLPRLLQIEKLDCVQWIQGAGKPLPSQWLPLLRQIQDAGKSVQVMYSGAHGGNADFKYEIDALCGALDPCRLFIAADVDSVEKADFIVRYARDTCRSVRARPF
jgi:hypothetical protein